MQTTYHCAGLNYRLEYVEGRSEAGRVSGPEYRVAYKLPNGRWLNGIRHTDGGDLLTHITIDNAPEI